MTSPRGVAGSLPGGVSVGGRIAVAHEEKRRAIRRTALGVGTLACGRCDAPIAVGGHSLSIADELSCPFCDNRGPVRDFLSLASPTRPARVVVRVGVRSGRPVH